MKIVFFAPHSAIWVHAFPEALVAEALAQAGHDVVYVTCGEVLQDGCAAMSARGLDHRSTLAQRQAVCRHCNTNKRILRQRLGLKGYDLAEILSSEERARVDEIVAGLNDDNFLSLSVDDVPVGRHALYELILHRKKTDLRLSEDEWPEYRAAVRGALLALFGGRRILDRERPDRLITYNSLYGVNRALSHLVETRGVASCFLHAGGNLSRRLQGLMVGRDHIAHFLKDLVAQWPRFRDRPCPPQLVDQITGHFLVLFGGKHVFGYSSAAGQRLDVRKTFGVGEHQRLLVATLSSPDERFAAQTTGAFGPDDGLLFPKQVDWIRALVRFVASRPDLFLLIRVHPREFPNKREGVLSQNAKLLTTIFDDLPPNVRVNWPTDQVSLYDLANYTDVFLNAWSSAGKEMALLGVPVVAYSPELLLYPADVNYIGTTEAEYFRKIDQALEEGWSLERCRTVYRWLAVEYGYGLADISDSYRQVENERRSVAQEVLHALRRRVDGDYLQQRDCSKRAHRLADAQRIVRTIELAAGSPLDERVEQKVPPSDAATEETALRAALVRLGRALFGDLPAAHGGPLARRLAGLEREVA